MGIPVKVHIFRKEPFFTTIRKTHIYTILLFWRFCKKHQIWHFWHFLEKTGKWKNGKNGEKPKNGENAKNTVLALVAKKTQKSIFWHFHKKWHFFENGILGVFWEGVKNRVF